MVSITGRNTLTRKRTRFIASRYAPDQLIGSVYNPSGSRIIRDAICTLGF